MKTDTLSNYTQRELDDKALWKMAKAISTMAEANKCYPQREQVLLTLAIAMRKLSSGLSVEAADICRQCQNDLPQA